ncbi:unnamed protein product, partial [Mesorhabditis belari]|uniref:Uncharacterized protein n=1 Tax=Mesorhabditis belari TaxID=2138241 RepID=A0AAF3J861_9BILA
MMWQHFENYFAKALDDWATKSNGVSFFGIIHYINSTFPKELKGRKDAFPKELLALEDFTNTSCTSKNREQVSMDSDRVIAFVLDAANKRRMGITENSIGEWIPSISYISFSQQA